MATKGLAGATALAMVFVLTQLSANPYPDEAAVPKDPPYVPNKKLEDFSKLKLASDGLIEVLRVELGWNATSDTFKISRTVRESSGTPALLQRASRPDSLGSYQAELVDRVTGKTIAYASLGTGQAYRTLARGLSFRFPVPTGPVDFRLIAENPTTGKMERVLAEPLEVPVAMQMPYSPVDIHLIRKAKQEPSLKVVYYSEGYSEARKEQFFQTADRATEALERNGWPGFDRMEFTALFSSSKMALGTANNLGTPVPERDSFLGLYFPYWGKFERWYHIVYPTRESRLREGLARAPHDYPIAIVDSREYWGVGNFNQITAVPSENGSFTYLLLHEFGHYFGLNEEYDGGGTELAFAPQMAEPWSQNMTFNPKAPKWLNLVDNSTPLPTPGSMWNDNQMGPIGAYRGGYASVDSKNHKPALGCVMESNGKFCKVCRAAIGARIAHDLGESWVAAPTALAHRH